MRIHSTIWKWYLNVKSVFYDEYHRKSAMTELSNRGYTVIDNVFPVTNDEQKKLQELLVEKTCQGAAVTLWQCRQLSISAATFMWNIGMSVYFEKLLIFAQICIFCSVITHWTRMELFVPIFGILYLLFEWKRGMYRRWRIVANISR